MARAVGVGEPRKNTRFQTKSRASSNASTLQPNIEEEDFDFDETEEENVDGYKFGSNGFESDGNLIEESDDDILIKTNNHVQAISLLECSIFKCFCFVMDSHEVQCFV